MQVPRYVAAAMSPDDWYRDFPTLQDALEFKTALAESGPTGQQVARKLKWRKKRLRYVGYDLTHSELVYLQRFEGQQRGVWQKEIPPHDEVM